MSKFVTLVNERESSSEMQLAPSGHIEPLLQQWIDRHNPQRVEYRSAQRGSTDELSQLVEFDDIMDYHAESDSSMRCMVAYRIDNGNQAARAEGMAIDAVLAGYRTAFALERRSWLIARGYVNVPDPLIDEVVGDLEYEWD